MKTSEILEKTGIPRHKLYYLEQKGYITPKRIPSGDLEIREYTSRDLEMVLLICKYLKMGFKHKVAYGKAMDEYGMRGEGNGAAGREAKKKAL